MATEYAVRCRSGGDVHPMSCRRDEDTADILRICLDVKGGSDCGPHRVVHRHLTEWHNFPPSRRPVSGVLEGEQK